MYPILDIIYEYFKARKYSKCCIKSLGLTATVLNPLTLNMKGCLLPKTFVYVVVF